MVDYQQQLDQQTAPIDFHTMYKKAQLRKEIKLDLKVAQPMLIYNMLQDMRHLVIADLRDQESFDKAHIRKAIRVDMETLKK